MADILITVLQALQLVALLPCLLIIAFLLLTSLNIRRSVVPALYFCSLCCSFIIPLLPLFFANGNNYVLAALLFGESLTPALCFLLVIQFLLGATPPFKYWLVLAIPVFGGTSFIYGAVFLEEVCLNTGSNCLEPNSLRTLYSIFSAAMIFLLLIIQHSRSGLSISRGDQARAHKYWLMMALIMLSVQMMVVDLALLAGLLEEQNAAFIATVIRIAFIYLVMTSLFRVFDRVFELDVARLPTFAGKGAGREEKEKKSVASIIEAMEEKKLYQEMGFSRADLAERIGIPEHTLSKLINQTFGKNFNEFINDYRIREAKSRLHDENTPVTVIAFEVGFNSIASFNRVFRNFAGMSPTEFRTAGRQPGYE